MLKEELALYKEMLVNGQTIDNTGYLQYHQKRISLAVDKLHQMGSRRIVEVGAHPWVMTTLLIKDPTFELACTVSAEELINWPDNIGVKKKIYQIKTPHGEELSFSNYSANVERTLFALEERPDTVIALEIIEHLVRSPHVMLLNINQWLPLSGKLLITTPNGAQFFNPLRRKSPYYLYRCNIYKRHAYVYTLNDLIDLVTLCGFKISEAGYWDVFARQGWPVIYDVLSHIPGRYFKDKFKKTIYLVAEKEKDVTVLERCPVVYDPRGDWEFISRKE